MKGTMHIHDDDDDYDEVRACVRVVREFCRQALTDII